MSKPFVSLSIMHITRSCKPFLLCKMPLNADKCATIIMLIPCNFHEPNCMWSLIKTRCLFLLTYAMRRIRNVYAITITHKMKKKTTNSTKTNGYIICWVLCLRHLCIVAQQIQKLTYKIQIKLIWIAIELISSLFFSSLCCKMTHLGELE